MSTEGATIGQAADFNAAAYKNLALGASVDDWVVTNVQAINSAGFGETTFYNEATDSYYVAIEGTNGSLGTVGADALIALGLTPGTADTDALDYVESVQDDHSGATVEVGGHSLGGQEAAYVSSETGDFALTENAPDPSGTTGGSFGDSNVLDINEADDIVGNDGAPFSNTVTLDTGASFFNQWGTLGTHSVEGLNDILYTIPDLSGQSLDSYSLDGVSSPDIVSDTDTEDDITQNPNGSITYATPDGSVFTVSQPTTSGDVSISGTFGAQGTYSGGTFTGSANIDDGTSEMAIQYSTGPSASYVESDDSGVNSTTVTMYNDEGVAVSTVDAAQSFDPSTGVLTTETDTTTASESTDVTTTLDSMGDSSTTTSTHTASGAYSTSTNTHTASGAYSTGSVRHAVDGSAYGGFYSVTSGGSYSSSTFTATVSGRTTSRSAMTTVDGSVFSDYSIDTTAGGIHDKTSRTQTAGGAYSRSNYKTYAGAAIDTTNFASTVNGAHSSSYMVTTADGSVYGGAVNVTAGGDYTETAYGYGSGYSYDDSQTGTPSGVTSVTSTGTTQGGGAPISWYQTSGGRIYIT